MTASASPARHTVSTSTSPIPQSSRNTTPRREESESGGFTPRPDFPAVRPARRENPGEEPYSETGSPPDRETDQTLLTSQPSIIALVVVVPKDKLTLNGPVKKWEGKGSSGKAVWRIFCSECGSPIAHDPDAAPEIIAIKGGTLDSALKQELKPVS